jgi:pyridoxine kinase
VDCGDGQIGCAVYDRLSGKANMFFMPKTQGSFPGAGDVFASALTAAFLSGKDFMNCVQIAMGFTGESIEKTFNSGENPEFGLCFETQIPKLIKAVK